MTVQDQRSLTDQLSTLRDIANRDGLYDAADYITEQLRDSPWLRAVAETPSDFQTAPEADKAELVEALRRSLVRTSRS